MARAEPRYTMPDQNQLSNVIIPKLYRDTVFKMKKAMMEIVLQSIPTDAQTSCTNDSYTVKNIRKNSEILCTKFTAHSMIMIFLEIGLAIRKISVRSVLSSLTSFIFHEVICVYFFWIILIKTSNWSKSGNKYKSNYDYLLLLILILINGLMIICYY